MPPCLIQVQSPFPSTSPTPDIFLPPLQDRQRLFIFPSHFSLRPTAMAAAPASASSSSAGNSPVTDTYTDLGFDPAFYASPYSHASTLSHSPSDHHSSPPLAHLTTVPSQSGTSSSDAHPTNSRGGCWCVLQVIGDVIPAALTQLLSGHVDFVARCASVAEEIE